MANEDAMLGTGALKQTGSTDANANVSTDFVALVWTGLLNWVLPH